MTDQKVEQEVGQQQEEEWTRVLEEGCVFYVGKDGNIAEIREKVGSFYIGLIPKVIKVGPFTDLQKAKDAFTKCKTLIDQLVEELNEKVLK